MEPFTACGRPTTRGTSPEGAPRRKTHRIGKTYTMVYMRAVAPATMLLLLLRMLARAHATSVFRPEQFDNCVPDGKTLCTAGIRKAIAACPASGGCIVEFAGPGTYLTQAFNLTSNLEVRIGSNATILATSEDRYNLNHAGGDCQPLPILPICCGRRARGRGGGSAEGGVGGGNCDSISMFAIGDWPVLPWAEYPSLPTRNDNPVYQAVIRGYNLTNVSIVAAPGGMLDCGGTYWCDRKIFCEESRPLRQDH